MSSELCIFPLCKRVAERSELCFLHAAHFAGPKLPKDKTPMPKRSEKMKEIYKGYKKQLTAYLAKPENKKCKIDMEGCTKEATCVHHVSGRIGDKLTDQSEWMPACYHCNLSVETNDLIARAKGFKKSKFTIIKGDEVNGTNILIAEAVSLKPT